MVCNSLCVSADVSSLDYVSILFFSICYVSVSMSFASFICSFWFIHCPSYLPSAVLHSSCAGLFPIKSGYCLSFCSIPFYSTHSIPFHRFIPFHCILSIFIPSVPLLSFPFHLFIHSVVSYTMSTLLDLIPTMQNLILSYCFVAFILMILSIICLIVCVRLYAFTYWDYYFVLRFPPTPVEACQLKCIHILCNRFPISADANRDMPA